MKYKKGETISFGQRLRVALFYKNKDTGELANELCKKGIDVNRMIIGSWLDCISIPNDSIIRKISEILFDDENALLKDDFLIPAVAMWNGTHNLSEPEYIDLMKQVKLLSEQWELLRDKESTAFKKDE